MARAALRIEVTTRDRKALRKLLSGGVQQVRVVLRAVALLQLAKGISAPRIAGMVPLTAQAIRKIGHRYQEGGLERLFTRNSGPEQKLCWKTARNSALLRWSAATHPRALRAGPCDWWPRKP